MHPLNEITQVFVIVLSLLNAFANEYRVGQEIGANCVLLIGRITPGVCVLIPNWASSVSASFRRSIPSSFGAMMLTNQITPKAPNT